MVKKTSLGLAFLLGMAASASAAGTYLNVTVDSNSDEACKSSSFSLQKSNDKKNWNSVSSSTNLYNSYVRITVTPETGCYVEGAPAITLGGNPALYTIKNEDNVWFVSPEKTQSAINRGQWLTYKYDVSIVFKKKVENAVDYTIKFDAHDYAATGTMSDQKIEKDDGIVKLSKNQFKLDDYDFMGWSTNMSNAAVQYKDEFSVNPEEPLPYNSSKEVTLYAVWARHEYELKVTFMQPNSKDPSVCTYKLISGTEYKADLCPVPAVEGYAPSMTAISGVMGKKDTSYTVTYSPVHYTLNFSSNTNDPNVVNNMESTQLAYDQDKSFENKISRTGYTFKGWAFQENATTADYNATGTTTKIKNATNVDNGIVVLYAVWEANTYKVTFNSNGATPSSVQPQMFTYDVAQNLSTLAFVKTGYTFAGWSANIGGKDTTFTDGQNVINLTSTAGGTVNLNAVWTANTYKVVFHMNDGAEKESTDTVAMTYDGDGYDWKNVGAIQTRLGYTLQGWDSNKNFVYNSANRTKIEYRIRISTGGYSTAMKNLSSTQGAIVDLYAVWSINTHTLKVTYPTYYYEKTDETKNVAFGTKLGSYVTGKNIYSEGYHFTGWNGMPTDSLMPDDDLTLTAQLEPNQFKIKFDPNAGTGHTDNQLDPIVATFDAPVAFSNVIFVRDGYEFKGWAWDPEAVSADFAYDASTNTYVGLGVWKKNIADNDSATLYALWTNGSYVVTYKYARVEEDESDACKTDDGFVAVGEDCEFSVVTNVRYGTDLAEVKEIKNMKTPANITGYTFSGWAGLPTTMPKRDVVVRGTYVPNNYYVKFLVTGDEEPFAEISMAYHSPLKSGSALVDVLADVGEPEAREGMHFSGWTDEAIPENVTMPAGDVTLKGEFIPDTFYVVYTLDEEFYAEVPVLFGTKLADVDSVKVAAPELVNPDSLVFSGWSELPETMPAENVNVQGSTSVKNFIVKWVVNRDTVETDTAAYGAMAEYNGDEPTKASEDLYVYEFRDWVADVQGWEEKDGVKADMIFNAKFDMVAPSSSSEEPEVSSSSEDPEVSSSSEEPEVSSSSEDPEVSSSSEEPEESSSSEEPEESSSSEEDDNDAIELAAAVPQFSVAVEGRMLQINAMVGAKLSVFDMQGRVITTGRVESANSAISLPHAGKFLVRVDRQIKSVSVK